MGIIGHPLKIVVCILSMILLCSCSTRKTPSRSVTESSCLSPSTQNSWIWDGVFTALKNAGIERKVICIRKVPESSIFTVQVDFEPVPDEINTPVFIRYEKEWYVDR